MPGTAKPRWASRGRISWTARVMVAGAGAGGAAAWVAAAGAQRALVGGGPRVGELGDQVAQVLPRQSGEDRMGEGRTGPWWSRHPRMMTVRPVPCATRCPRSTTAIAHQVVRTSDGFDAFQEHIEARLEGAVELVAQAVRAERLGDPPTS